MFLDKRKRETAMTVVMKDDKVLILQRSDREKWMPGRWNLPGGSIETGETPKQAAKRECQEETGIRLSQIDLTRKIEKPNIVLWFFAGEADREEILLDPRESSDYAWVDEEQIDDYHFVPDCKDVIQYVVKRFS